MDPRTGRFGKFANGNGIQFGNQGFTVLPDENALENRSRFDNTFSIYAPVNDMVAHQDSRNFRGLQFDPPTNSSSPVVTSSLDDELNEDCDLSDAILGYISQVLMEEDMEDKSCTLYESLDLQAAEKSFYDVLGKKYPPSPSYDEGLFSVDQYLQSPNGSIDYLHGDSNLQNLGERHVPCMSVSSSNSGNNIIDVDSPLSTFRSSEIRDGNQMTMMMNFNKGVEEANKFLPINTRLLTDFTGGNAFFPKFQDTESDERRTFPTGSRVRKSFHDEEKEERSIKQAAIYGDQTLRTEELDLMLLDSMGQGDVALRMFRTTLQNETSKVKLKDKEPKPRRRSGKKKQNNKKEVIDLRTLLITCAQAVAADDRRNASELLKQIRQHASPFGDGNQRLAHCFANGLEARLAGTGSQIHRGLISKKTSASDYIKAYHLYVASSPFRKISNYASNRTILDMSENATRIHIIDFGILYGFQWPTFIQRVSQRDGGPPSVRLTGIEFPQPGFRPAETIEETGARLKEYAKLFNVPFDYNPIAKRWENVKLEDLKIQKDEFLVVNCMYRSKNLLDDETVGVDSARNVVLDLIKTINPNVYIHGILNGSYNAPFFVTRFREALFHFSALFDMLETNVPRERPERKLLEGELFGREIMNVVACEGWERIERPETYKQWHVRNLRAGYNGSPQNPPSLTPLDSSSTLFLPTSSPHHLVVDHSSVEKFEVPMEFLQAPNVQVGIAFAVVIVTLVAFIVFSSKKTKGSIDPENYKQFKLVKRTQLSHNVAKFRFALPTPTSVLGLPIGQHISCRGKDSQGEEVIKPYTPTTLDSDVGYFELVIKMYPQGRMSHHFREMREGDYMAVKGPKGRFRYQPGQVRAFGMIAGGSGITPMFQVARAVLENPADKTKVHLIYANVTSDDILLKAIMTWFILVKPPEGWTGGVGFVTKEMIEAHLPARASDIKILRCGPPPMNKAMAANLEALGYESELLFQF
ncbi:hypothetical protein LXL04_000164 [Taraxacum kok-saghyz]